MVESAAVGCSWNTKRYQRRWSGHEELGAYQARAAGAIWKSPSKSRVEFGRNCRNFEARERFWCKSDKMAKIVLELTVTNDHFRIRPIFRLPGVLARDERVLSAWRTCVRHVLFSQSEAWKRWNTYLLNRGGQQALDIICLSVLTVLATVPQFSILIYIYL